MDETEPVKSKPELSDSWMVINNSAVDQENQGAPTDGSDGESVEVIDQEEYEEALVEETVYYSVPPEEEITGPKNKKYVHHPNNDVNAALNKLMIIAATVVVGLAVGHYLGYSEEVTDLTNALKKLEAENIILKNHICELFNNFVDHNTENPHIKFRETGIDSTLYHIIVLDIKCPVLQTLKANVQADLYEIMQNYAKGHLTEDRLKEKIEKLFQNTAFDSKFSESAGEHDNLSDQIKQALLNDNLSADKLQEIVDKSLQSRMNSQPFSKIHKSEGEHNLLSDETLDDTASAVKSKEYSTKNKFNPETSSIEELKGSVHSFKSNEKLLADNSLEKIGENVREKRDETVERAVSQKSATSNVLTESPLYFKSTEGCLSSGDLQNCLSKLEPPTENILKHIVKDMVHEMTESFLLSHHNNILKDIRDETKALVQSVPLFKSVLLLNMEAISKLKSHVNYVKNTFKSFIDDSHGSVQQEKLANILNDVSKHTQTIEKAMDTLHLLEAAINQKKEFALNNQQDKACAGAEFFEQFYINNSDISEGVKNHSVPYPKSISYSDNQQESNSVATESTLSSSQKDIVITSITGSSHKTMTEKNGGEMVQETGTIKQEDNDVIHHGDDIHQELTSNLVEKVGLQQGNHVDKRNPVTDTNKHIEPKLQSNENEQNNVKYSKNKHNAKYQDSKKIKRNKKEHKKGNKKENREKINKREKKLKRDSRDIKKKHVHHSNVWAEDEREQRHSNVSGEWVINLNRWRAESREAEHRSDWLFDRASARSAKRQGKWDMRNWYFQRADSRNYCRKKPNSEKSKCSPENKEKQFHGKENKRFSKFRKYFKPKYWLSKAYMAVSKF